MKRWDDFRLKRSEILNQYFDLKQKIRGCTTFVILCFSHKVISKVAYIFFDKITKMRAKHKMLFYLKVCLRAFRKTITFKGKNINVRNL